MASSFSGKVAIVTGGASGIGRACAWALAEPGATVLAADIDLPGLEKTAADASPAGRVTAIRCDVTSKADVRALMASAEAAGGLDVAINCAGILQPPARFEATSEELFNRIMRVNVYGVWLCMQQEVMALLARGEGAIVNVASAAGLVGVPMMHAYTTSKHAIVGLTRSVGSELVGRGIRVNAVCPGATSTPMTTALDHPRSTQPDRRMAQPEEIANAILFLASNEASYVAAAVFAVDNGFTSV